MWQNIIGQHIRRSTRNLLIAYVLGLILVLGLYGIGLYARINFFTANPQHYSSEPPDADMDNYLRLIGYSILAVGVLIVLAFAWQMKKVIGWMQDPQQHPIAQALKRFGEPAAVAARIDREMQAGAQKIGPVTLTTSWLLSKQLYGLDVVPLHDLVWIYKKATQHYHNLVPTGRSYEAIIWHRDIAPYQPVSVPGNKQQIDKILLELSQRVPWVLAGYDKELDKAWRRDQQQVLAMVDQKRIQVQS